MNELFKQKEIQLLLEVLNSRLGTLKEEIYHAEAPAFKDELKMKKQQLEEIIQKLERSQKIGPSPTAKVG